MKRIATVIFAALLLLASLSTTLTVQAYDWNYGAASMLYGSQWQQRNEDISNLTYALGAIEDLFYDEIDNSVHVYGHLWEWTSSWYWNYGARRMKTQIQDCENDAYHNWATVFYYGHMGMEHISGPYYHYGFHESGTQTGSEPNLIWDDDIDSYTDDNHNFVFLWVCENGAVPGDDEPVPHGMAYCWFGRNFGSDGYNYPDAGPDCFIGFDGASPVLGDGMGTYTQGNEIIYRYWLVFFYYFALNGYSIKGALDQASYMVEYDGYWLDENNRLSQGWDYYFPGWVGDPEDKPDYWPDEGNYAGQAKVYGNVNIYLPQD